MGELDHFRKNCILTWRITALFKMLLCNTSTKPHLILILICGIASIGHAHDVFMADIFISCSNVTSHF